MKSAEPIRPAGKRSTLNLKQRAANKLSFAACLLTVLALGSQSAWARRPKAPENEPDYTKGEKPVRTDAPWNMGPTGATGNIWGTDGDDATSEARMVQINSVAEGSPADGQLEPGDVIVGVVSPHADGPKKPDVRFSDDVRMVIANSITLAETKEHQGKLVLNVWRKGKTMPVTLKLPVKGSFSETTPYDCKKTQVLIDEAAEAILRKGFYNTERNSDEIAGAKFSIDSYLDALGLLATANPKYLPEIQKYARDIAKGSEDLDIWGEVGAGTWNAAYRNLFLTEYFLATKDQEVLPGIKALSTFIALGQSGVGTWSHGMAAVKIHGLYGPPMAYGSMNSASVPCALSLMLAQKCGIKEEPIDLAVTRSLDFFRWYTDKGIPPYGDHAPKLDHDNNGKGSMTAVLFDVAGEEEQARYFTRCTLASYNTRETGHTGNFFSMTWGAPGAARGGPLAAQSFVKNTLWMTELERRHDGSYRYQYQITRDTKKYGNWSTTGVRLLQHCLPLKAIHLTGKDGCVEPMNAQEVAMCEAAAIYDPAGRPIQQLLDDLGSWSPVVREKAATELGQREEDVVKVLIGMLDSPNRYARYGACRALYHAGRESENAVAALANKVTDSEDLTMRYYAVISLERTSNSGGRKGPDRIGLGDAVLDATDTLLKQAATYEPKKDPMRKLHNHISSIVFGGYFAHGKGLDQVDRKLLIPAIKSILTNPNGGARSAVARIFDHLSEEDLEQLYGDIFVATKKPAPSGVMFSSGIRISGANLLAKKQFEEGLPVALDIYFQNGWGTFVYLPGALQALTHYGSEVKPHVDKMKPSYTHFLKRNDKQSKKAEAAWKKIQENLDKEKKLKSIKPYLEAGGFDPSILD